MGSQTLSVVQHCTLYYIALRSLIFVNETFTEVVE